MYTSARDVMQIYKLIIIPPKGPNDQSSKIVLYFEALLWN